MPLDAFQTYVSWPGVIPHFIQEGRFLLLLLTQVKKRNEKKESKEVMKKEMDVRVKQGAKPVITWSQTDEEKWI